MGCEATGWVRGDKLIYLASSLDALSATDPFTLITPNDLKSSG